MSEPKHARAAPAAILLALALVLAGCGSSATGPPAAGSPAPAVVTRSAGRPAESQLAAFAHAFARKYPKLAAGRKPVSSALTSMMTARSIAPQQTRYHPMARETVYALARAERRSTETLRGLAAWMGVQD
jgi:hypothetical protein